MSGKSPAIQRQFCGESCSVNAVFPLRAISFLPADAQVDCEVGKPKVNFRETIQSRAEFAYTHKKQSGGAGQFGRVLGYIEPLGVEATEKFVFINETSGNNIPPEFHAACEKGFKEASNSGTLIGAPVEVSVLHKYCT
jgi:elongation factor G